MKKIKTEAIKDSEFVQKWCEELERAEKKWGKFKERAQKVIKIYSDECNDNKNPDFDNKNKKLNILWSNTETIKPALYNNTPEPEVIRRNREKDPLSREASDIIEKSLSYCMDSYDFDEIIKDNVHYYSLINFATSRIEYVPTINTYEVKQEMEDESSENEENTSYEEELDWELVKISFVNWEDFLMNVCRTYDECRWQAFRHYFSKEQLTKITKYWDKVPLDFCNEKDKEEDGKENKKAVVWEIWDKDSGKVIYISRAYKDRPLAIKDPFCKFNGFFCSPRPLLGLRGTKFVPIPDYVMYQDQAEQVNFLTEKLYSLSEAINLRGVYNGNFTDLQRLVSDGGNVLIPVQNWESFAQNGGVNGNISWIPLKEVVDALVATYDAREKAKMDIYEATGISDIVRGASNPNETATAQAIKNQWGSLRIRDRQKDIQRFIRDLIRLKAEVIAEHFSLETLKEMSGVKLIGTLEEKSLMEFAANNGQQLPPEIQEMMKKPTWEEVYALLRDDKMRSFSIRIETDSTIAADEQQEKADRTEFLNGVSSFITSSLPIIQAAPEMANMIGAMLTFAVRGFKVGGELETIIESTMEQIAAKANQPQQQPQIEPKDVMKAENDKAKLQLENKKADQDFVLGQEEVKIKKVEILQDAMKNQGVQLNGF